MRWKSSIAILVLASAAWGGWYLVRNHIRAGALAGTSHDVPKPHVNRPPHGGTVVALGDDQFNLELLRDPASGILRAYVLDGEMEEFIRVADPEIDLAIVQDGRKRTLVLKPVADRVTGETVGSTSLFEGQADWLKRADRFEGVLKVVAIQDQTFQKVAFSFPEGNAKS